MNRKEQKDRTRKKIIDAAAQVFAEQGFSVSTGAVAKQAGIAHGSVFVHFPTKEALLEQLIGDFFTELAERFDLLIRQSGDIRQMLEVHLQVLREKEAFYQALIRQTDLLPESTRLSLAGFQSVAAWHFTAQLKKEMAQERVKNIKPHMLFNTWMGLIHYYLLGSDLFAPGESVLSRYQEELIDTFINLIAV